MWRGARTRQGGRRDRARRLAILLALALLAVGLAPTARPVAAAPAIRLDATANFGGNFRPGTWAPITVRLANDGTSATGEVVAHVDAAGDAARYVQRVELPTRSQKALTLYAFVPRNVTAVEVSFRSGKDVISAPPVSLRPLRAGQSLIGAIGDDTRASTETARALLSAYGSTAEAVAIDASEAPDNPYGLGSFSSLIVSDASTGRWSPEQRRALAVWVAQGGQLVVAGGPNWRKTGEGLGELPPVRANDSRTVRGLDGLGRVAGGAGGPDGAFVVATGDVLPGAERLADQDGAPLVARRGWGKGTVTYLAFDPGTGDFLRWGGVAGFWRAFGLDAPLPASLQEPLRPTGGGSYSSGAYSVDRILQDLPALALPPTWLLLLVMLCFITVVGPVNYLLLRWLDRRELAWVTIPALTLLFAGAIYGFGAGTKGRSVIVNTVSVVRIAPGGRAAEAQSFYGVFTPSRGKRQLPVANDALLTGFSDDGLGEAALGKDARYEQGADAGVRDASFAQWTLGSVAAQAIVDPAPLALRLELRGEGARVVGTITNTSGRPVEDVTLLLDGAYQPLGALDAGASVAVNWTPAPGSAVSRGLGSALYYQQGTVGGSYGGSNSGAPLGMTGRRAELLDALSGSVLATGTRRSSATGSFSPTPTPVTGGSAAAQQNARPAFRATPGTLQVLFWRPDAPLELGVDAGERAVTTLIVQETFLDPQRQAGAAPLAGLEPGGAR